ncbi:MAG TPA: lysylphosphatidylglycerol synthase transmembrane domain-containing protein [Candidatus Eisenbacteria bacterium]
MSVARAPAVPGLPRVFLLLAKIAISAALMVFLFRRVPIGSIGDVLGHARGEWLAAAAALLLFSNVLGSYQWHRLLEVVGIRIPFWKTCAYYHVGLFFNNFLPANIGGDIARVMDAARHGPTRAAAISTVLMDRLIGTVALAGLALVTTLPAVDQFHLSLVYGSLAAFFALCVVLLWAVFHPALLPAVERGLSRLGLGGLKPHLDELAERLHGFRSQRRLMLKLFLVATVTQVSRIGVHVLVARALALDVALPYFFLFVPLLAVIVSLPISLNGIGVREGAGIVLFGMIGVSRAHAFSLQFTTYLVAVAISLLGGMIFLLRLPVRRASTRSQGRPS